jgi:hypothetical protein
MYTYSKCWTDQFPSGTMRLVESADWSASLKKGLVSNDGSV